MNCLYGSIKFERTEPNPLVIESDKRSQMRRVITLKTNYYNRSLRSSVRVANIPFQYFYFRNFDEEGHQSFSFNN